MYLNKSWSIVAQGDVPAEGDKSDGERKMYQYLEWELNVDPAALKEFHQAFLFFFFIWYMRSLSHNISAHSPPVQATFILGSTSSQGRRSPSNLSRSRRSIPSWSMSPRSTRRWPAASAYPLSDDSALSATTTQWSSICWVRLLKIFSTSATGSSASKLFFYSPIN